ncbi:hypothetical protein B0H65DRAFT_74048 [Neurospora tetraspora]|uniref:Uncharacterized protein n=1 Tax=Neurospora tetraspora TaxID=94610 RepID=A0AAE0J019_9PEZI|nr:hypothetical protein B0H65DRAFT_74048 [Neurospora tetraspora]
MTTTPEELSPLWRKLPIELVQGVLAYFIDDLLSSTSSGIPILAGPVKSDEEGKSRAADLDRYANGLVRLWRKWRHDSLFKHQRKRIERHFRDVWLNAMTFYLHVEEEDVNQTHFCRYLPVVWCLFVWEGPADTAEYIYPTMPPDVSQSAGHDHDGGPDSDSEWATF